MGRLALKVLAVGGIASAGVTLAHSGPSTQAARRAAAPMMSTRYRAMGAWKRPAAAPAPVNTALQTAWMRLINAPQLQHSAVSAYAVDLSTHQVLASVNPTTRLTPGSVTKLFTTAAALNTLGPTFTYTTRVMASPAVIAGAPGPIYLVGGGDPWLEANGRNDLEVIAQAIARQFPQVTQVIGVSSLFAQPGYGLGWPLGMLAQNFAAATSSLMAERSEVAVWVKGAGRPGQAPSASLQFNGTAQDPHYFTIVNHASTGAPGTADTLRVTRPLGTNNVVLTGRVPVNTTAGPWVVSAGNPPLFAASLFQTALSRDGVHFSAGPSTATTVPAGLVTVAHHESPPLSHELQIQNQFSINQMAENLYQEVGTAAANLSSAQVMAQLDSAAGITPGRVQVDGSGLSPLDQMSAQQIVQLLTYAAHSTWFPTFRKSLIQLNTPKACGFLCPPSWQYQLPARTTVWLKTGNLSNQWNMAGYATTENGQLVAFAILDDGTATAANAVHGSPVDQMMADVPEWPRVAIPAGTPRPPAASGRLPVAAARALARLGNLAGANVGMSVVNVANGQTVYQQNGQVLMRAGLAPRLVLDAAALDHAPKTFGGTALVAGGAIQNGQIDGPLIIQGTGADLTSGAVQNLVRQLTQRGIRSIAGPIEYVNPHSGFHQTRWPSTLSWNMVGSEWAPPASSLYFHNDQATLTVTASSTGTTTATVSPSSTPVTIVNQVTSTPAGTPNISAQVKFPTDTIVVSGTLPAGAQKSLIIAPPDPGLFAADQVAQALTSAGIAVAGTPHAIATAPSGTVLARMAGTSTAALVQQSLTVPSIAPSELLQGALGTADTRDLQGIPVGMSDLGDMTGAGLENYLTPDGLARFLARQYRVPAQQTWVAPLSSHLWETTSPEQTELMGYIPGPFHSVDAVVILVSGTPWNGDWTPNAQLVATP